MRLSSWIIYNVNRFYLKFLYYRYLNPAATRPKPCLDDPTEMRSPSSGFLRCPPTRPRRRRGSRRRDGPMANAPDPGAEAWTPAAPGAATGRLAIGPGGDSAVVVQGRRSEETPETAPWLLLHIIPVSAWSGIIPRRRMTYRHTGGRPSIPARSLRGARSPPPRRHRAQALGARQSFPGQM